MSDRWLLERLSSLCTVIAGQSPKASYYNDQGNGLPFYQGKKEFTDRLLGQPTTWTTNVTKVAEAGDVLMSVRAPVGPINQATEEICIGRGLAAIRPNESLNRDYLWHALMWLQPTIRGHAGAVFDSINKTTIESLKIPHPPLEEQRRIVAILDEAFEGMDRARALVEANLRDAWELFQSILSASVLKTGWQKVSLGSLCNVIAGQSPRSSFYNTHGQGLPFYQGKKGFTDRLLGQPTTWTTNVTKVAEAGDVLMSVRAPVGPINQATEKICIGRGLAAIRPNESLNRDYLWYVLMWLQPTIGGHAGAVFDSINKSTIESLKIPFPPLEEQRQVAVILDEVSDSLTLARSQIEVTLADIEEVRQSALKRAFAGDLA